MAGKNRWLRQRVQLPLLRRLLDFALGHTTHKYCTTNNKYTHAIAWPDQCFTNLESLSQPSNNPLFIVITHGFLTFPFMEAVELSPLDDNEEAIGGVGIRRGVPTQGIEYG